MPWLPVLVFFKAKARDTGLHCSTKSVTIKKKRKKKKRKKKKKERFQMAKSDLMRKAAVAIVPGGRGLVEHSTDVGCFR